MKGGVYEGEDVRELSGDGGMCFLALERAEGWSAKLRDLLRGSGERR